MRFLYFKDLFTIGCITSGFAGSLLAIKGHLDAACYSMLVSFVFDISDGSVARLTGRANAFGKVFDNVADLIPYSVAPACIAFAYIDRLALPLPARLTAASLAFAPGLTAQVIFAAAIGAFTLLTGCLRLVRNQVYPVDSEGFDLGLSRPASAFLITGLVGNHFAHQPYYVILAPFAIAGVAWLNLAYLPFVTNKGPRFSFPVKCLVMVSALLLVAAFLLSLATGEPYFMDLLLVYMILYLFSGYAYTTPAQRRHFETLVRGTRAPRAASPHILPASI